MHRSRKLGLVGLGASLVFGAGCITALGDFNVGAEAPAGGDGGDAGSTADTSSPILDGAPESSSDAADASDAGPPPLACDTWRYPAPVVLEDLSRQMQNRTFNGRLYAFTPVTGTARVITSKNDGTIFTVYSVDDATQKVAALAGPPSSATTGGSSNVDSTRRVSLGLFEKQTSILVRTSAATAPGLGYDIYMLPDSMGAAGPIPTPQTLMTPAAPALGTRMLAYWPYAANDFFLAQTLSDSASGTLSFNVARAPNGRAAGAFSTVATSVHRNDFQGTVLLDANGKMYAFTQNDDTVLGTSAFALPESAVVPAAIPPRTLSSGKISAVFDAVPNSTPTAANIVYAEGEAGDNTFRAITLRVGAINYAKLDTFTPGDLPVARKYSDLTQSPFGGNGGNPQWRGDEMVAIGQGFPAADGGIAAGYNFLWVDAQGNVRSEQVGGAALLRDRVGLGRVSAAPAVVAAKSASWNVAWVEQRSDATGAYEVLLFNQLRCQ